MSAPKRRQRGDGAERTRAQIEPRTRPDLAEHEALDKLAKGGIEALQVGDGTLLKCLAPYAYRQLPPACYAILIGHGAILFVVVYLHQPSAYGMRRHCPDV